MNFQTLKEYFQEFIECNQHKIMFLNGKYDIFEEFKVIDAINFLEEKDEEIKRLQMLLDIEKKKSKLFDKDNQLLYSNIKDATIKLYELNYKLKEIHNIPFDIVEIFEIIDLLDRENE